LASKNDKHPFLFRFFSLSPQHPRRTRQTLLMEKTVTLTALAPSNHGGGSLWFVFPMSSSFFLQSLDVNSFSLTMQNFTTSPGLTKSPTALVDEIFEQYADREEPRIPTSGKNLSVQSSTPSEISLQRGHHRDLSSNSASSSATS